MVLARGVRAPPGTCSRYLVRPCCPSQKSELNQETQIKFSPVFFFFFFFRGARWLSGRVSDSGARGPGFETYRRHVVSLSKTLYSPKVLVNYPGSDGSVPT